MRAEIPQFVRSAIDTTHQKIVHPYLTHGEAKQDREVAHTRSLRFMTRIQDRSSLMWLTREMFVYEDPILETEITPELTIQNPIIMPAGFDKKVEAHRFLGEGLGFGAVTVGTITKIPYRGNEPPRIFDLPGSDGLINRMGFPGDGSDKAEKELHKDNPSKRDYTLLISIGASRPSFEKGTEIEDFVAVAKQLIIFGDGQEQNISSPNTPGVTGLQKRYHELAPALNQEVYKPFAAEIGGRDFTILAKVSPDLPSKDRYELMKIGIDNGVNVYVLGNTTTDPDIKAGLDPKDIHRNEQGGVSGQPLRTKALENSHEAYILSGGQIPIIMAGGVKTTEDIWNGLTYGGASAVEVFTAFVRPNSSTPNLGYYLLRDLARAMRMNGMSGMEDFKDLRGKKVSYPLAQK